MRGGSMIKPESRHPCPRSDYFGRAPQSGALSQIAEFVTSRRLDPSMFRT